MTHKSPQVDTNPEKTGANERPKLYIVLVLFKYQITCSLIGRKRLGAPALGANCGVLGVKK